MDDAGSTFSIPFLNSMTTHLVLTDAVRNCPNWGFNCRFVGNKPLQPQDRRTAEEACARSFFSTKNALYYVNGLPNDNRHCGHSLILPFMGNIYIYIYII